MQPTGGECGPLISIPALSYAKADLPLPEIFPSAFLSFCAVQGTTAYPPKCAGTQAPYTERYSAPHKAEMNLRAMTLDPR
jgi:hypothetical protein